METLLDVPLREVRVFRNSVAQQVTRASGADAVTVENQVYMAPERGQPSTPSGQALLAHELSHVAATQTGGRREAPQTEETHAQAIEHAVATDPEPHQRPVLSTPATPLGHRRSARPNAPAPPALSQPASYSGGGFVGGGVAPSSSGGSSVAVARAPVGRVPATAAASMTTGLPDSAPSDPAAQTLPQTQSDDRADAGTVDRLVEAVLRRLRRDGALERERRGAFRSEIGG
jgi:Domain of unknown function (DUF4157)